MPPKPPRQQQPRTCRPQAVFRPVGPVGPSGQKSTRRPARKQARALRQVDGSRRPEIGADGNTAPIRGGGRREAAGVGSQGDRRRLRQDGGRYRDGAKRQRAVRRRHRRVIGGIAARAIWATAHVRHGDGRALAPVLRHCHRGEGESLRGKPEAKGNEQDQRAEPGKSAISHGLRVNTDAFQVQGKLDKEVCSRSRVPTSASGSE